MSEQTARDAQAALVEEFGFFDNWTDRYQYIIDMGKQLPSFPEAWKVDAYKIKGCQSQVWIHASMIDGKLHLDAISDAAIVSGLIAMLLRVYSDRSPIEILQSPPEFLHSLGLAAHLSPTRSNGLNAMVERIFGLAREAQALH